VSLPSGWLDASQVVALGPEEGGFRPNLVVGHEPCAGTAAEFAAALLPQLRKALPALAVAKEGPATFGALSGFLREQTFTSEGQKVAQLQFFVVQGRTVHTFTFTHLAGKLDSRRRIAGKIFAGLELAEPAPEGAKP